VSVVKFPVYAFSDPRSSFIRLDAERYKRVVQFDTRRQIARLVRPHDAEWYSSKADVIRFPVQLTKIKGEL